MLLIYFGEDIVRYLKFVLVIKLLFVSEKDSNLCRTKGIGGIDTVMKLLAMSNDF